MVELIYSKLGYKMLILSPILFYLNGEESGKVAYQGEGQNEVFNLHGNEFPCIHQLRPQVLHEMYKSLVQGIFNLTQEKPDVPFMPGSHNGNKAREETAWGEGAGEGVENSKWGEADNNRVEANIYCADGVYEHELQQLDVFLPYDLIKVWIDVWLFTINFIY